jgi:hypothetical protein
LGRGGGASESLLELDSSFFFKAAGVFVAAVVFGNFPCSAVDSSESLSELLSAFFAAAADFGAAVVFTAAGRPTTFFADAPVFKSKSLSSESELESSAGFFIASFWPLAAVTAAVFAAIGFTGGFEGATSESLSDELDAGFFWPLAGDAFAMTEDGFVAAMPLANFGGGESESLSSELDSSAGFFAAGF